MTSKQILDSFSETLMHDERILSARERALLSSVLQHARPAAEQNPETQEKVRSVIASAIGETVAQRAFAVLGAGIVERILEDGSFALSEPGARNDEIYAKTPQPPAPRPTPQPPAPTPQPPVGTPQPPAQISARTPQPPAPVPTPQPPAPTPQPPAGTPQPPSGITRTHAVSQNSVGVMERAAVLPAKCAVLDEFLAPQQVEKLMSFALGHESEFVPSALVSPHAEGGVVNYGHRRSRVLMDLEQHQPVMLDRIKGVLPEVLAKLGMEEFSIAEVEAQITASGEGDFFLCHNDSGNERVANRRVTFVYFFHREPRQFEGGELRIHDARLENGEYVSEGSYQTIVPQQNQIVFFPCELLHEITPVKCPSGQFTDSRFTMNGWLHQ